MFPAFWGFLLKLSYIVPFAVFYVLIKRYNSLLKNHSYRKFFLGIALLIIGIFSIFFTQVIKTLGLIDDYSVNLIIGAQVVSNTLLIMAYFLLFYGIKHFVKADEFNLKIYYLLLIFFLFTSNYIVTDNLLLVLAIVTYCLAIFTLILCFLTLSQVLQRFKISYYYLPVIGVFFLIIDPILYFKIYPLSLGSAAIIGELTAPIEALFYFYRFIAYSSASIAMLLVLLPVSVLLVKILTKQAIVFKKDDTVYERVIKKLTIKMQRIVGKVSLTVIKRAGKAFEDNFNKEVEHSPNLDIKGLSLKEQKRFLALVIKKYYEIIGKPITNNLLKRISDEDTQEVIVEFLEGQN